jgi:hypothetical protein
MSEQMPSEENKSELLKSYFDNLVAQKDKKTNEMEELGIYRHTAIDEFLRNETI